MQFVTRCVTAVGAVCCFCFTGLQMQFNAASSGLKFDTEGVSLRGTLVSRTFYGPPGFGETPAKDVRDKVIVLKLLTPITVEPVHDAEHHNAASLDTVNGVREIQLFFVSSHVSKLDARRLTRKPVRVVGRLEEAVSPGQHTKVTMEVTYMTAE